jgi:hypothetical protein
MGVGLLGLPFVFKVPVGLVEAFTPVFALSPGELQSSSVE